MTTPRDDLQQVVHTAARWSLASSITQRVAQVGVGIAVARLVAPADMGVYATALLVIALVVGISELGVSVAVVRADPPVERVAPTAVTIAWTWSCAITVGLLVWAPWFAQMLGSPAATGPLRLMALAVVVGGVSAVPAAIAQRTFRHRRRAVSEVLGFGCGAGVTLLLAAVGAGAWSLAAGRLATNVVGAAVLVAEPALRHRPNWHLSAARELLRVGVPLTGAGLVALALWQVDSIVVSRMLGSTALGVYVLAFNLASWPVTALSVAARAVTLPAFAELRSDPQRCAAALPVALRTVLSVTAPAVALLMVTAPSLVRVVYGVRWSAAGQVLVVLALLGALRVGVDVMVDFLAAAGRTAGVWWTHVLWLGALIPSLIWGAEHRGLVGVGAAHVLIALMVAVPVLVRAVTALGVAPTELARAIRRPIAAAVTGGALGWSTTQVLPDDLSVVAVSSVAVLTGCALVLRPWRLMSTLTPAREVSSWS